MYPGGDRTKAPNPDFNDFVTVADKHTTPWYFNESVGEKNYYVPGSTYNIVDYPAYRNPGIVNFFYIPCHNPNEGKCANGSRLPSPRSNRGLVKI